MSLNFENGIVSTSSGGDTFISSDLMIAGTAIWVDSVTGNAAYAGTEEKPLDTLANAITAATANNGDIIILKSGHTETLTGAVTINKAGLKIFGLGSGSTMPKFTMNAAVDGLDVSAAGVHIYNLYFPAGTTAGNTGRIDIAASGVMIKGCQFLCGLYDQDTITIAAGGTYATIDSCTFTVSADGPDSGILVEAAAAVGLTVSNCSISGGSYGFDNGGIYSAFAHTGFSYDTVTLTNYADIVHTAAAKGWTSGTIAGDGCYVRI